MSAKYLPRLEEGVARIKKEINETGWLPLQEGEGIKVVYKELKPERYQATVELDASAQAVLDACYDWSKRLVWDKSINSVSKVLQDLGDNVDIVYQMVDGRLSVSARDFVNARIKVEGADVTVVVQNAAEDSIQPVKAPTVRGKHHDVGYAIVPLGENKCRLHWFVQTELGGWIMINVRSIVGQNIAELIKNLRAHLAQQH